jgi:hypothetical protein
MSILSEFLHNYAPQNGWGTFFTAAFGAFAGAFAASRAHNKRTIVAELNALSAAHELSVSIANRFMAFKRQQALPLKQDFERIKAEYNNHQTMIQNGGAQNQVFHFTADFQSLSLLAMPGAALEKMIFEKTLIRGRALAALVELVGAIDGLAISINARNEMVEERRNKQSSDKERLEFFLGLRTSTGTIDGRFATNIASINAQTDDGIFFAKTLASDIIRYANAVRNREGWTYRLRLPKMAETDWSHPKKIGMLPKDEEYEKWLRGFPLPPETRWQRFVAACRSPWSRPIPE